MQKASYTLLLLFFSVACFAQTPYFQQGVDYTIHVKLDDQKHFLYADEELVYTNNSPESLDQIVFHLWPNAYKHRNTAFGKQKLEDGSSSFYYAKPQHRGYIDSLDFKVDGQSVKWSDWENNPDVVVLQLNKPIPPKGKVTITTPFRVKIPLSYSRLGHIRQQYQLCQWFPKPAVFDHKG